MSNNSKSKKAILLGIGAAVTYSFIKGNGIFNKPRFYHQHKALKKYLSSNHPNAYTGEITKTKNGWSCIINDTGRHIAVNMEKSEDGTYIFSEQSI